jgi:hypothetical protein
MDAPKELKWGETPWDNLSREELLLEIKRMYSALVSVKSALSMLSFPEGLPYFSIRGTGGRALEKARQVLQPIHEKFEGSAIYSSYFRYADDLLFERGEYRIGSGWAVCPECGVMLGETGDGKSSVGEKCRHGKKDCDGVLRPIQWSDLEKADDQ